MMKMNNEEEYSCIITQCTGTDNCTFTSRQKALGLNDFTKVRRKFDVNQTTNCR